MNFKATRIKSDKPVLKALTQAQLTVIAGAAIVEERRRVVERHEGIDNTPMRPYSPKGPIYVPLTGKGRTKTSLGGREIITPKDRGRAKKAGTAGNGAPTPSRKSMKFANYASFKRYIGKDGQRDLERSGRMLRAVGIVSRGKGYVEIGFFRREEELKARGNERRVKWFGLSPKGQRATEQAVTRAIGDPVKFE
jgi:hypothetical protein